MSDKCIIGWDFGTGRPVNLFEGDRRLQEITLVKAHPAATAPTAQQTTNLRIWGLHPCLITTVTFFKRIRDGMGPNDGPFMDSQVTGFVKGYPIVKTSNLLQDVIQLPEIPATDLFLFGGGLYDGCELNSGMQGIEFLLTASLLGPSDHDVVATIQTKQKEALGCIDLAKKLAASMKIEMGAPLVFP